MPREQLQFTETCHSQNLCKKPFNFTDLAVGPAVKELMETLELQRITAPHENRSTELTQTGY